MFCSGVERRFGSLFSCFQTVRERRVSSECSLLSLRILAESKIVWLELASFSAIVTVEETGIIQ